MLLFNRLRQAPEPTATPAETRITEIPQDASLLEATDTIAPPIATSTPAPTVTDTPSPIAPVSVNTISIPAGEFIRGSTVNHIRSVADHLCSAYSDSWCSQKHFEDELPVSEVGDRASNIRYLDSNFTHVDAFLIDLYEVTNGAYARCVATGVCDPPERSGSNPRHRYFDDPAYANYPVIYVSAEDAATYCRWVGGRLPTADEWEKAARGTEGNTWPWGNRTPSTELNFRRPDHRSATEEDTSLKGNDVQPVGSYPGDVSPYGVYDMAGNVMEWTGSMYGPGKQEIRGGSWNTGSYTTRTANRVGAEPDGTYFDVGFRCAYKASP
jgi:formylglycine-generating enzyme required for sulfatase activity